MNFTQRLTSRFVRSLYTLVSWPWRLACKWVESPRANLRLAAVLCILLIPFTGGSQLALLHTLAPNALGDELNPLGMTVLVLVIIVSICSASAQLWVSDKVLRGVSVEVLKKRLDGVRFQRTVAVLRVPTLFLWGFIIINAMTSLITIVTLVLGGTLVFFAAMLYAVLCIVSLGAFTTVIDLETFRAGATVVFQIASSPVYLLTLEEWILSSLGPIILAPFLFLSVVVSPTVLAWLLARKSLQTS